MNIWRKFPFFVLTLLLFTLFNFSFSVDRNLPWVTIISRSERWADESLRLRNTPRPTNSNSQKTEEQIKAENISKIRNAWMAKNFPFERKYEWSNLMFWKRYLIYPEYFNYHKNKIVIHHTAWDYGTNRTINDVKKEIQQIYKYHTINRNFGDIWYNFLIDQMWNIYEWRAWWQWAVWMHASSNNVSSIWIALMWNFEYDTPTVEQMSSLVNLATAIAKFYHIDPHWYTNTFTINTTKEPYVTTKKNPNIMWHENIKATACPWKNLYKFLPRIRDEVLLRMKRWTVGNVNLPNSRISELKKTNKVNSELPTVQKIANFPSRLDTLLNTNSKVFQEAAAEIKNSYKWKLATSSNNFSKISKKYSINDIKNLINKDISVLLYELTTKYDSFKIECDVSCIFNIDGVDYKWNWATLTFLTDTIKVDSDRSLYVNSVTVKSSMSEWTVKISNYNRKSYMWILWNRFKGSINFEKWIYPLSNWEQKHDFIVVNTLPFSEYMKWIVETNDTETLEKNKVMALISKNYALFYLNKENVHPNISKNANYSAIDDPNFFQKYVWAWLEKTLTKWYQALEATKNYVVMYNNYLPILPYFNCSAGFTLSAEEKWWWNDTPYLKSVYDFKWCNDFIWHWVWLAGNWAERFAQQWMSYDKILKYYYDGVSIEKIN